MFCPIEIKPSEYGDAVKAHEAWLARKHAVAKPVVRKGVSATFGKRLLGGITRYSLPIIIPRASFFLGKTLYADPIGPRRNVNRDIIDLRQPTAADIVRWAAVTHGITKAELIGSRRDNRFIEARFKAAWLLQKYRNMSLPVIGRILGGRDHTTILHATRRASKWIAEGHWTPPDHDEICLCRAR